MIRPDLNGKGNYIQYWIGPEIFTSFTEIFLSYNGVLNFLDRRKTKKWEKVAIFLKN